MKKLLNIFFILYLLQSCTQKSEILDGFGKAKIGMSVNNFFKEIIILDETIDTSLKHKKDFKHKFNSLKISEKLILKNITVVFENGILKNIEVDNSAQLFELLEKNFKIKKKEKYGKINILEFDTNNEKTKCIIIENAETKNISLSESVFKGE